MVKHAVILAVGNPDHHSRLIYNRAHAMLPALGKPLVVRIMDRLYRIGIRKYTVVVGASEGAVAAYLNTHWMPDVAIEFVLKTANDSLLKLLRNIAQKHASPFILCSYNSFTHTHFPERLIKQYEAHPESLVFSAAESTLSKSGQLQYAILDGHNIKALTRIPQPNQRTMTLTDFTVCGTQVIAYLHQPPPQNLKGEFGWQLAEIARHFLESGGSGIVATASWILQVQTDYDLIILNKHLLDEGVDAHILSELPYTVQVIPPVRIDPQVSVGQGSKIGPHVYLERGCSIGCDVIISNSIVLEESTVPSNKTVFDTIISPRGPVR